MNVSTDLGQDLKSRRAYDLRPMTRPDSARWFWWGMVGVVAGALAIRLAYILVSRQHIQFGGDAFFYHGGANLLADGKGFISPFHPNRAVKASEHPPLYMLYLAIPSLFGFQSQLTHLIWSAILGVGTVVVIGLTGREIGGTRLGLIAAALAAAYPNMWIPDGSLMIESMAIFATAVAVYLAYRCWREPSWWRLAAVGAASGAAALSRSELILMVPFMVVPLGLMAKQLSRPQRWIGIGAGVLASLIVMAPWLVFNLTRFEKPELLTSSTGLLLAATNCDDIWRSEHQSYFSIQCTYDIRRQKVPPGLDQSEEDVIYRDAAIRYIKGHTDLIPGVVAARVGAILGVYQPSLQIQIDGVIEGRGRTLARAGMYSFYAMALLSVAGAIALRRRRSAPVFPLLVPPAMVLITVVLTYASTRFRASAEVSLCILAAVAIDAAINAVQARRSASQTVAGSVDADRQPELAPEPV